MNDRCKYHYLYNYCTHTRIDIKDYAKIGLDSNPSNATILTLHTAYKAQKLEVTLANGLDSIIESRDRQRQAKLDRESQNNIKQQSIDSLLIITLINGGYKGKLWGFSAMPHLCPPLQAKRFFSRYDLLIHQPNTESGFSATLLSEKNKRIQNLKQ